MFQLLNIIEHLEFPYLLRNVISVLITAKLSEYIRHTRDPFSSLYKVTLSC